MLGGDGGVLRSEVKEEARAKRQPGDIRGVGYPQRFAAFAAATTM
jgi:hypothetical protein